MGGDMYSIAKIGEEKFPINDNGLIREPLE